MGSINSLVHVFPIQFAMLDLPETCREILFSFRTKHHPFLLEARMARLVVFGLFHYHPGPSPTCDVIVICINCHQRSSCSYSPLEPLQSNPQCCVCLLVAWCLLFVFCRFASVRHLYPPWQHCHNALYCVNHAQDMLYTELLFTEKANT